MFVLYIYEELLILSLGCQKDKNLIITLLIKILQKTNK